METTAKRFAIGVSALCCALASVSFAANPSSKTTLKMSGLSIGFGGGASLFAANSQIYSATSSNQTNYENYGIVYPRYGRIVAVTPVTEFGWTAGKSNFYYGFKTQFHYDNVNLPRSGDERWTVPNTRYNAHWEAMLMGGYRVSDSSIVYLQGGYASAWVRIASNPASPSYPATPHETFAVSGGALGVGWRYYFVDRAFFDLRYQYDLFADHLKTVGLPSSDKTPFGEINQSIAKPAISTFTASANYMFSL